MGQQDNGPTDNLREEMLRLMKAEFKATNNQIKAVTDDVKEAKTIAISARDKSMKPHDCAQVETITEMKALVASWASWWRGAMVTIFAAIIVFGGAIAGWWYSHSTVKTEVTMLSLEVVEIKEAVESTNRNFGTFRASFETQQQQVKKDNRKQVQDIAAAVGQAVKTELKNSRRR
jgi:hypothetical protein